MSVICEDYDIQSENQDIKSQDKILSLNSEVWFTDPCHTSFEEDLGEEDIQSTGRQKSEEILGSR